MKLEIVRKVATFGRKSWRANRAMVAADLVRGVPMFHQIRSAVSGEGYEYQLSTRDQG